MYLLQKEKNISHSSHFRKEYFRGLSHSLGEKKAWKETTQLFYSIALSLAQGND